MWLRRNLDTLRPNEHSAVSVLVKNAKIVGVAEVVAHAYPDWGVTPGLGIVIAVLRHQAAATFVHKARVPGSGREPTDKVDGQAELSAPLQCTVAPFFSLYSNVAWRRPQFKNAKLAKLHSCASHCKMMTEETLDHGY
jgi:hypothetical protein